MKWLHISDIHFNFKGFESNNLHEKLLNKLKELKLDLDFILVTGDCLYQNGKGMSPNETANYIKAIARICSCSKKNVYICQGNHDVNRSDLERNEIIDKIRSGDLQFETSYDILNNKSNEKFQIVTKNITGYEYESYKVFSPKNAKYRIVSLNSGLLSKDKNDYGNLKICNSKLMEIGKKIYNDNKINILIMHHGIELLESKDAILLEHWIEDNYIDMVFCGHTHRAAIDTFNDVYRDIKQFTAGAIIVDGYAVPSFYYCEYDDVNEVTITLYTYSIKTEEWDVDNYNLRKFRHGVFKYLLSRETNIKSSEDDLNIDKCKDMINRCNREYKIRYKTDKIYVNKFNGNDYFDTGKIIRSLGEIGMPYARVLDIVLDVIKKITSDNFITKGQYLSSDELRNIIYGAIVTCEPNKEENEFDVSCWASRYARKYNPNIEIMVQKDNDEEQSLNYSYIQDKLLKQVIDSVTGNSIYYRKIIINELKRMSENILSFLKNMGIFAIKEDVLKKLVVEYITQNPHPWVVNNNSEKLIKYHKIQAENHILELKNHNELIISQIEAAYHICALFLTEYDKYIGCTETSPIIILSKAINGMSEAKLNSIYSLPMERHQIIQLKKDLQNQEIDFYDFARNVSILNNEMVDKKLVTGDTTKEALFSLWDIVRKLEQNKKNMPDLKVGNPIERIKNIFNSGKGFLVKSNLKALPSCFWIEPNWEDYEIKLQHLGKQLLVCIIDKDEDVDEVYNYLYINNTRDHCVSEVAFALNSYKSFTREERKKIRARFKGKSIKCIFIQESDYSHISDTRNWRDIFYEVISVSKIS